MLGDPEYIQLLVNPCTHMIAVRKSVRQDYLAHHVRACYSDIRNSYELYSRELLQTLRQTNTELSNNKSYRCNKSERRAGKFLHAGMCPRG